MNTLQTPSRASSLNPFDIGTVGQEPTTLTRGAKASFMPNEVVEEVEEFGCVDWYLYPRFRGRKGGIRSSSVVK